MPPTPSWQAVRGHDNPAPTERPPAPPPFVSAGLLAGMLPAASEPRLAELVESQLVRLNACEARLDLELGGVLATFSIHDVVNVVQHLEKLSAPNAVSGAVVFTNLPPTATASDFTDVWPIAPFAFYRVRAYRPQ